MRKQVQRQPFDPAPNQPNIPQNTPTTKPTSQQNLLSTQQKKAHECQRTKKQNPLQKQKSTANNKHAIPNPDPTKQVNKNSERQQGISFVSDTQSQQSIVQLIKQIDLTLPNNKNKNHKQQTCNNVNKPNNKDKNPNIKQNSNIYLNMNSDIKSNAKTAQKQSPPETTNPRCVGPEQQQSPENKYFEQIIQYEGIQSTQQSQNQKSSISNQLKRKKNNSLKVASQAKLKSRLDQFPELVDNNFQMFWEYRKYVEKTLDRCIPQYLESMHMDHNGGGSIRGTDSPFISFTMYKKVLYIWQNLDKSLVDKCIGQQININTHKQQKNSNNINSKNTSTNNKLKFLKYGQLRRLNHKNWLNDQIISSYLVLIRQKLEQQKKILKNLPSLFPFPFSSTHNNYIIFDSLKTQSVFNKISQRVGLSYQEDKIKQIQNILVKNNISREKFYGSSGDIEQNNFNYDVVRDVIIIVINASQHWFFVTVAVDKVTNQDELQQFYYREEQQISNKISQNKKQVLINPGRYQPTITIYDSKCRKDISSYEPIKTFKKIQIFFQHYFNAQPQPQQQNKIPKTHPLPQKITYKISNTYPQQTNNYDCGVMMLCGVKDLVRDAVSWNFGSYDVPYRRVLITKEIVEEEVCGFYV